MKRLSFFTLLALLLQLPLNESFDSSVDADADAIVDADIDVLFLDDQRSSNRRSLQNNNGNGNGNDNINDDYLDFTQLLDPDFSERVAGTEDDFLGLLSDGLLMAKDYAMTIDESTGGLTLNTLISNLLDENGFVKLEIENGYLLDMGSASNVNLTHVGVTGLDTFRTGTADILKASYNNNNNNNNNSHEDFRTILENEFVLETLILDLYCKEYVTENGRTTESELVVRLPFAGVNVTSMPVNLALSEGGLLRFPLGAVLNGTHAIPCLQDTVVGEAHIREIAANFEFLGIPSILSTTASKESPFFGIVTTLFVGLPASVPIFFNTTIRNMLNDYLTNNLLLPDDELILEGPPCPSYPNLATGVIGKDHKSGLIDFSSFFETGLPALLLDLLDEQLLAVDPSTGSPKINEALIVPMMESMMNDDNEDDDGDDNDNDDESGAEHFEIRDPLTGRTLMVFGRDTDSGGDGPLVDATTSIDIGSLEADVRFRLKDLEIYNLDTMVPPLEVLQPVPGEAQQLDNTITMGYDPTSNSNNDGFFRERSMGVAAKIFVSVRTEDSGSIEQNIRLETTMERLGVNLKALLEIVRARLYGFPAKDILNLHCWLATLRAPDLDAETGIRLEKEDFSAGIAALEASLAGMTLKVGCLGEDGNETPEGGTPGGCSSSPSMGDWAELLDTPEARAGLTESANSLLDYVGGLLSDGGAILQIPIDRMLKEAPPKCPHHPGYLPQFAELEYSEMEALPEYEYSYIYLYLWGSLAVALVAAFGATCLAIRCSVRKKHRGWLRATTTGTAENNDPKNAHNNNDDKIKDQKRYLSEELRRQIKASELEKALNASTLSMFRSANDIPCLFRYAMPVIILGNIGLFLSGHLNLGATVYIEATLAGDSIRVGDFFDFAIARTTIDLWKAGGRALAMLIFLFSGLWPYTKQFLTLVLWFLPPTVVSVSKRGTYLVWLDRLAKWSMIDIFVIVVCIAAFRVSVQSPENLAFLPDSFYSLDLMVIPQWGLYSNMTAQIVSQVSSHFVIYYHRRIVANATESLREQTEQKKLEKQGESTGSASGAATSNKSNSNNQNNNSNKILLRTHAFSNPHRSFEMESGNLVAKAWVGPSLLVACGCVVALVAFGSFVASFSVEVLGMIGVAVESGQNFEDAITRYSVWSIPLMLFEEAKFLGSIRAYIGITAMVCLFLGTILVAPILQSLGLLYQWFVPLPKRQRQMLTELNEILQAWQYVEVYLISLFVASWQLGTVSQYMFNSYCGGLDTFFAQMVSYGILKDADAQCFSVQGSIDPGSIALLLAAILLAVVNSVVTLASKQSLEEYDDDDDDKNRRGVTDNSNGSNGSQTSGSSNNHNDDGVTSSIDEQTKIRDFPFRFTDGYRWLVKRAESGNGTDS